MDRITLELWIHLITTAEYRVNQLGLPVNTAIVDECGALITLTFRLGAGMRHARPKPSVIDNLTPHIFRHTYATILYNASVDVKSAQRFLGHADINMTSRYIPIFQPKKSRKP